MNDIDAEKAQYIRQFDAGKYLKSLREGRSLTNVCKELEVSTAYLSEVERGRMPSDLFITKAAAAYGVDEDDLFSRWGKIPILAQREVKDNPALLSTLSEIGRNRKLTDEDKERLYESLFHTYREFIDQIEAEKKDAKRVQKKNKKEGEDQ